MSAFRQAQAEHRFQFGLFMSLNGLASTEAIAGLIRRFMPGGGDHAR